MSKPDWKDAPEWADYLAMDESGYWYWYALEPTPDGNEWGYGGNFMKAEPVDLRFTWDETLEKRPNE